MSPNLSYSHLTEADLILEFNNSDMEKYQAQRNPRKPAFLEISYCGEYAGSNALRNDSLFT